MTEPVDTQDINPNVEEPQEPVVEDTSSAPDPVVDEQPIEGDGAEEPEVEEPEEQPKPSRRETLRINQLLEKYGEPEARPVQKPQSPSNEWNLANELDADPETIKRLQDDRESYADKRYAEGVSRADSLLFQTRLEVDAPKVETKYPFLDKNSDEFNPVVADAINRKYLQFVGFDPNSGSVQNAKVRYSDFVEAEMEFANELASNRIEEAKTNITKQAARTGLRPDGSAPKRSLNLNKPASQMSDEELAAKINAIIPTKR